MKKIVILGAYGGIGSAVSKIMVRNGYHVYACGRKQEKLNQLCMNLPSENVTPIVSDIANYDALQSVSDTLDRIDAVVNCVGILKDDLIPNIKIDVWEDIIKTNFLSSIEQHQSYERKLNHGAVIIHLGSIAGIRPKTGQCAYAVSKAMTIKWAQIMAIQKKDTYYFTVSPGPVDTDMIKETKWYSQDAKIRRIPLQRYAKAEEIAQFIYMLIENPQYFNSGDNFVLDGGFLQTVRE